MVGRSEAGQQLSAFPVGEQLSGEVAAQPPVESLSQPVERRRVRHDQVGCALACRNGRGRGSACRSGPGCTLARRNRAALGPACRNRAARGSACRNRAGGRGRPAVRASRERGRRRAGRPQAGRRRAWTGQRGARHSPAGRTGPALADHRAAGGRACGGTRGLAHTGRERPGWQARNLTGSQQGGSGGTDGPWPGPVGL